MAEQETEKRGKRIRTKSRRQDDTKGRYVNLRLSTPVYLRLIVAAGDRRMTLGQVAEEALTAHLKGYAAVRPTDAGGEGEAAA